jgi:hypothetical protein
MPDELRRGNRILPHDDDGHGLLRYKNATVHRIVALANPPALHPARFVSSEKRQPGLHGNLS